MSDRTTRAAQKESDHHRWDDDGGFIPEPAEPEARIAAGARNPWIVVVGRCRPRVHPRLAEREAVSWSV